MSKISSVCYYFTFATSRDDLHILVYANCAEQISPCERKVKFHYLSNYTCTLNTLSYDSPDLSTTENGN